MFWVVPKRLKIQKLMLSRLLFYDSSNVRIVIFREQDHVKWLRHLRNHTMNRIGKGRHQ